MVESLPNLRLAGPEDAARLADLGARTFQETFAGVNTPEDMRDYLRGAFSPEIQAAEIAQPGSQFLILERDGEAVGYARLLAGSTDPALQASDAWRDLRPVEISRVYLLQGLTGQRLGDVLMQGCIDLALQQGAEMAWLGVWEHNPRAVRFYRRWGFEPVGQHVFQLGSDAQTDLILARRLSYTDSFSAAKTSAA